jgi:uracil-DNA glycosylase
MPYIQKPDKRKNDNAKIVNARVSEDVLKALSMADDDSNQFDYSFTLTGVIKKALDDLLTEIHQDTGIDYYKFIKWEKKIKDRFENDDIQSIVAYDHMILPWIVEVGSAFNLIFKNYSTLEAPDTPTSDSVSYIIPNASAREKDYFNNNMKKNLSLVGPRWNPYNADGLEYSIEEALENLSNYIFEEHFLLPVIHINVTQEDDATEDLSMMKSQIIHYLKQHPQVISFCSCSKVNGGNAALWVDLKPLKNGLDFKILFDNVKHEIYDDVLRFENFDDALEAKEKQLIGTWYQAHKSLKSKEDLWLTQHQVDVADYFKLKLIRESMNIGDWLNYLSSETNKPYFKSLNNFLSSRFEKNIDIYPPKDYWFKALEYSSFDNTKVIILGQDPYHGEDQAEGLSFSVPKGIPIPPSLSNIYEELETDDVEFNKPSHGNLISWAKQGVLLLNSVLTVEKNTPTSHTNIGWETFTDQIIKTLSKNKNNLVFILWGTYANTKSSLIDSDKHLVLESFHPSPFSATKKGKKRFFGCKHFSKTNNYLKENDIETINWSIPK